MWFGEGGYKKDFAEEGLGSILTRVGTWQEMGKEKVGGIVTLKETAVTIHSVLTCRLGKLKQNYVKIQLALLLFRILLANANPVLMWKM